MFIRSFEEHHFADCRRDLDHLAPDAFVARWRHALYDLMGTTPVESAEAQESVEEAQEAAGKAEAALARMDSWWDDTQRAIGRALDDLYGLESKGAEAIADRIQTIVDGMNQRIEAENG